MRVRCPTGVRRNVPTDVVSWNTMIGDIAGGSQVHGLLIKFDLGDNINTMIGIYAKTRNLKEAFGNFRLILSASSVPTRVTCTRLFSAISSKNVMSWTTLISGYSIHVCFQEAMDVFSWIYHDDMVVIDEKMFRQIDDKQNMLFWTTVISGNVHNGFPTEALENFSEMLKEGVKPDTIACVSVVTGCVDLETIEQGELIHAYVTKSESGSNISIQTALILLYANCGCFCFAVKLFEKMMEHDVVSFTALISGHLKFGYSEEALLWLCGAIDDAVNYFNWTQKHDTVVWNSMLAGHAHHGNSKEVLKAFDEKQKHGMNPDAITFLSVLSGCSHGNLLDRVMIGYFVLMHDEYVISPMMEHFAVVVDALGRAGLFHEAVKFVEGMDSEAWIVVLRSLLSCCILHGSTQLGLPVVANIMERREDDAATYVLLSKLYAIDGRWDDARKVREVMERKLLLPKVLDSDDFRPVVGEKKQSDESRGLVLILVVGSKTYVEGQDGCVMLERVKTEDSRPLDWFGTERR
ncbi:hypothetical protein HHK36_004526 [Tetracentron sinense]|uniref:Pentatricopeptide repeat-containing protein n=1 Tax=Tetracentron sinense TaxID=13715 RepID=A0A834ZVE9_TETSI|nr:hypothetical protein HHK36_004526 [Tetracentron sinense]